MEEETVRDQAQSLTLVIQILVQVTSVQYIAKLQLNSQLHLHSKSIQLLQELSWGYAL